MVGRWFSGRALLIHLTALVVVPACALLCWWQIDRALGGNSLSWAYVFEWPVFGCYALYMWWRLLHDAPIVVRRGAGLGAVREGGREGGRKDDRPALTREPAPEDTEGGLAISGAGATGTGPGPRGETPRKREASRKSAARQQSEDEELAAYNRYLAELDAGGRRKRW